MSEPNATNVSPAAASEPAFPAAAGQATTSGASSSPAVASAPPAQGAGTGAGAGEGPTVPAAPGENNLWRVKVQGKDSGDVQTWIMKGPLDRRVVAMYAQWNANAQSRRAMLVGLPDPELKIVSVDPIGKRPAALSQLPPAGFPAAKPIDLNRYTSNLPLPEPGQEPVTPQLTTPPAPNPEAVAALRRGRRGNSGGGEASNG